MDIFPRSPYQRMPFAPAFPRRMLVEMEDDRLPDSIFEEGFSRGCLIQDELEQHAFSLGRVAAATFQGANQNPYRLCPLMFDPYEVGRCAEWWDDGWRHQTRLLEVGHAQD